MLRFIGGNGVEILIVFLVPLDHLLGFCLFGDFGHGMLVYHLFAFYFTLVGLLFPLDGFAWCLLLFIGVNSSLTQSLISGFFQSLSEVGKGFFLVFGIARDGIVGEIVVLGLLLTDAILQLLQPGHRLLGFIALFIHGSQFGIGVLGSVFFLFILAATFDVLNS